MSCPHWTPNHPADHAAPLAFRTDATPPGLLSTYKCTSFQKIRTIVVMPPPPPPRPPPPTTVADLVNRFANVRPFAASNTTSTAEFNADTFNRKAQEHVDRHNFAAVQWNVRPGSMFNGGQRQEPPIIQNVATFEKNFFFRDPADPTRLFSCCDEQMKLYFETRGFISVSVLHFTGGPDDQRSLPTLTAVAAANETQDELELSPGPTELKVPVQFPKMWCPRSKTTAWCIIHAFEVKVYDPDTKTKYSPYRLWSPEARKAAGTKSNTKWTKYCQAYFILKRSHGPDPSLCNLALTALAASATQYNKDNPPPGASQRSDFWYPLACSMLPVALQPP